MFKIGDRVICDGVYEGTSLSMRKGKVVVIGRNTAIGIEFDEGNENFHDCGGKGKEGHCWFVGQRCISLDSSMNTKISISDVTTEFEKLNFHQRSILSLSKNIGCSEEDVRIVLDGNPDIFVKNKKGFYQRRLSLE